MRVLAAWRAALSYPGLIGLIFAVRSGVAAVGAVLCLGAFSPSWVMGLSRRDESVFEPGLGVLLRVLSENQSEWRHFAHVALWFTAVAAAMGSVLVAFLLHALGRKQKPVALLRAVVGSLPSQFMIQAAYAAMVLLAIFVTRRLSHLLPALVYPALGERGADAALLVLALILVAALVGLRITCDLVRAGVIQSKQPVLVVAAAAVVEVRKHWHIWGFGYLCFALSGLLSLVLVEWWFPTFGNAPSFGLWPTLAHQIAVALLSVSHLGWWVLVQTHFSVPPRQKSWSVSKRRSFAPTEDV